MQKFLSIPITATGETAQLVAVDSIVLIEQDAVDKVTVHYANGAAANDVVTINHTTMAANDRTVRDRIQDSVIAALQTSWVNPKYDVSLSGLTSAAGGVVQVTSIGIA
jgi:hypothetical protein